MSKSYKNFFTVILFLLSGGLLSACLRYELQWDLHNYHFYNGFAFLNGRLGYDLAPAFQMTFNNPLLDVITYLAAAAFNTQIVAYSFVMGLYFGCLLYILFLLNKLFFDFDTPGGKAATAVSIAVGVTGFATWFQIGSSTGEIPVSVFVLAGLYVLIKHWFVLKDISEKHFLLAGFLLGTGAGLKLTAAMYCLTCGFTVLLFFRKLQRPVRQISCFIGGGLLGFLLFNGFWMIMLYKEYGNPFFPFFNAVFKSPWFPEINTHDTIHTQGASWLTRLMLPLMTIYHSYEFPVVGLCSFTDSRFFVSFILLIGFCCRLLSKKAPAVRDRTKFIVVFAFISYIFWLHLFSIIRYTIPVESIIGIAFAQILFRKNASKLSFFILVPVLLLLLSTPVFSGGWTTLRRLPSVLVEPDNAELSDDTLVFLINSKTSSVFTALARKHPKIRAVSFHAPELLFWKIGQDITDYGKFAKKKAEIIQNHTGDILMIIASDASDPYPENHLKGSGRLLKNAVCFNPEMTFEKDGKKGKLISQDFRLCKISKK